MIKKRLRNSLKLDFSLSHCVSSDTFCQKKEPVYTFRRLPGQNGIERTYADTLYIRGVG